MERTCRVVQQSEERADWYRETLGKEDKKEKICETRGEARLLSTFCGLGCVMGNKNRTLRKPLGKQGYATG